MQISIVILLHYLCTFLYLHAQIDTDKRQKVWTLRTRRPTSGKSGILSSASCNRIVIRVYESLFSIILIIFSGSIKLVSFTTVFHRRRKQTVYIHLNNTTNDNVTIFRLMKSFRNYKTIKINIPVFKNLNRYCCR